MKTLLLVSSLMLSLTTHAFELSNKGSLWTVVCADGTSSTGNNSAGLSESAISFQAGEFCKGHGGIAKLDFGITKKNPKKK